ncbi:MAG TPA: 50S ribosomal protein L13 [Chlamydiales bacterium]|nr:50S ribosomal protein L13 [Chlamydiales bacterium]
MKTKNNSTTFITKEKAQAEKNWFLFDAKGKTLGRFASEVANVLRGKHKPTFAPHVDTGDGVIILNADQIAVTGAKEAQKVYRHYTGAIGGLREIPYRTMQEKKPEEILRRAVKGMMPKTKLANQQLKRLRIFRDENHGMEAQKPIAVNI